MPYLDMIGILNNEAKLRVSKNKQSYTCIYNITGNE